MPKQEKDITEIRKKNGQLKRFLSQRKQESRSSSLKKSFFNKLLRNFEKIPYHLREQQFMDFFVKYNSKNNRYEQDFSILLKEATQGYKIYKKAVSSYFKKLEQSLGKCYSKSKPFIKIAGRKNQNVISSIKNAQQSLLKLKNQLRRDHYEDLKKFSKESLYLVSLYHRAIQTVMQSQDLHPDNKGQLTKLVTMRNKALEEIYRVKDGNFYSKALRTRGTEDEMIYSHDGTRDAYFEEHTLKNISHYVESFFVNHTVSEKLLGNALTMLYKERYKNPRQVGSKMQKNFRDYRNLLNHPDAAQHKQELLDDFEKLEKICKTILNKQDSFGKKIINLWRRYINPTHKSKKNVAQDIQLMLAKLQEKINNLTPPMVEVKAEVVTVPTGEELKEANVIVETIGKVVKSSSSSDELMPPDYQPPPPPLPPRQKVTTDFSIDIPPPVTPPPPPPQQTVSTRFLSDIPPPSAPPPPPPGVLQSGLLNERPEGEIFSIDENLEQDLASATNSKRFFSSTRN